LSAMIVFTYSGPASPLCPCSAAMPLIAWMMSSNAGCPAYGPRSENPYVPQ